MKKRRVKQLIIKAVSVFALAGAVLTSLCTGQHVVKASDSDGDIVIMLDAGHGGKDPGAISDITGIQESDLTWATAIAVKEALSCYEGVKVYLSRDENTWFTNTGRAMAGKTMNADFIISLHYNSSTTEGASGSMTYRSSNVYYETATVDMSNRILAKLEALGLKNNGAQTRVSEETGEDYYTQIAEGVRVGVPVIIVEHLFLSSASDVMLVSNEQGNIKYDYIKTLGEADAAGIAEYFSLKKRTANADSVAQITINPAYGLYVNAPGYEASEVNWYSVDEKVATVDASGLARGVGAGTTNIVYKTAAGESGFLELTVNPLKGLAISAGLDPTFYATDDEFKAINLNNIICFQIWSDGYSRSIIPDNVGTVEYNLVGIQDIPVTYQGLTGFLRVVHNTAEYVPVVTLPPETEAPTTPPETQSVTESAAQQESTMTPEMQLQSQVLDVIKWAIILLIVIVAGVMIIIIIKSRRGGRRDSLHFK